MVLQNRLDYGFHGFQFPPTPRAARSARRRRAFKKTHEDSRVCAFDLLAIVAGKLLLENEPTSRSNNLLANQDQCENTVKQEIPDGENPLKVEAHLESPSRSLFVSDIVTQVQEQNLSPKESAYCHDDLNLVLASAVTSELQEVSNPAKLVGDASKDETEVIACKVEAGSSCHGESSEFKLGVKIKGQRKRQHQESRMVWNGAVANMCTLKDSVLWNKKPPAPVSSDNSPRVPLYGNHLPRSSYPTNRGDVDIVGRDDDENSSGCTYLRSTKKYFRSARCIGDRRIRKILASRYWKVATRLKDVTHSNTGDLLKPVYHHRKNFYKNQRSEKIYPFKKRKYFQYSSPSYSYDAISSDFVLHSHQKGGDGDVSGCCQKHEGTRASSSITSENTSCQPRDSHVKLRIKSFRVPELFIEVPQSATVASLKRTVMEAVAAVLGGGLRVGVLLHGKKVRDDNKTLLQTGISHNHQLDAVGFSLEPNHSQNFPSLCGGGSPIMHSCDTQPLSRYPPSPGVVHHGTCAAPLEPQVNNLGMVESDHDSAPSPVDMSMDKSTYNSKVLVAMPAINVEALAMVPAHRKNKRSEVVQRRIRRPFSVSEVEGLVQAVEKLGTGRWRDVKLIAFDNAKHRTYVDLKDKWKTLVHTAKISPQQRRGEPVPQELLDRVLTAHAYWSEPQATQQQVKHPHLQWSEACLLLQGPSNNSNQAVGGHV